jgi:hypothetical protein
MAKSNRRRKQDRAKTATRQAEAHRRLARTAQVRAVQRRLARIHDPATPAAELAALLTEHYRGVAVAGWLVTTLLAEGSSPQRLADTAQLMLAADAGGQGSSSLTSVTFAAAVARAAGDPEEERRLIDLALAATEVTAAAEATDDLDARLKVIDFISTSGHAGEAVELLEPLLREIPEDDFAAEVYGAAISAAYALAEEAEPGERERGHAAVARFADRSGLTALRDAIGAFLAGTELGQEVQARVSAELPDADDVDWTADDRAAFGKLAEEIAWLTVNPARDSGDLPDDEDLLTDEDDLPDDEDPLTDEDDLPDDEDLLTDEDDASGTPLMAFSADPSTPPALAARAAAWYEYIHYGLWRIVDPVPAPGLWCTELVSGTVRYVEFPPEATAGLARWTVWLGGIVPVDGIWHSTGLGVRLSPAEGDAAADFVDQAAVAIIRTLDGKPEPPPEHLDFGQAEPQGVYVDYQEAGSADVAKLTGKVTGAVLAQIAAEVHDHRTTPSAPGFAWPAGQRASRSDAADAAEGWPKYWLDEPVPALRGRTPRQAAAGQERPLLEALLREFEYEADLLAADGKSGVDAAWLREQLDMAADPAD